MAVQISSEDKGTSLYLIQIQYLDEQLERCQREFEALQKQNEGLSAQHAALGKDKKNATDHLKRCLAARQRKGQELTEQLQGRRRAAAQDFEGLRLQHRREMRRLQERASELDSESRKYADRFEEEKEELRLLELELEDTKPLEELLLLQREEHEAAVRILKEQTLGEEKLLEELRAAADVRVQLRSDGVLLEELQAQAQTLQEQQELQRQEKEALQEETQSLRGRQREAYLKIGETERNLREIFRESAACRRELEQLPTKCRELRAEIKICSEGHQHILSREEDLRKRLACESKRRDERAAEVERLTEELQRERSRETLLEGTTQEASAILTHILRDSKTASTRWKTQRLLQVLESSAPPGAARGRETNNQAKPFRPKKSISVEPPGPPPEDEDEDEDDEDDDEDANGVKIIKIKSCDSAEMEEKFAE